MFPTPVRATGAIEPSFQTPLALNEGTQRYYGRKIRALRTGALQWVFQDGSIAPVAWAGMNSLRLIRAYCL